MTAYNFVYDSSLNYNYMQKQVQQPLYSYGMHFCPSCKNLMKPHTFNGPLLDFICERCNRKQSVDYHQRTGEDCLLYSKELQAGTRSSNVDLAYIFDPTVPSVDIECPKCGYGKAVYMLTPDEGQTKLLALMICAHVTGSYAKCGHSWILDEDSQLTKTKVVTEEEKFFQNF